MKKTLNDLKPAMMRVLERRYGKEQAADRWDQMEKQYAQWLQEEGDLGGKSNMMSSNMTLCYHKTPITRLFNWIMRTFHMGFMLHVEFKGAGA